MSHVHSRSAAEPWSPAAHPVFLFGLRQAGFIKRLNRRNHRVQLTNGKWYILPETTDMKSYRIGERVEIHYELNHHHYYATSIRLL
jgi:hypothetical protein